MANKKNDFYWNNFISAADTACLAADYLLGCLREFDAEKINEMLTAMHKYEHQGDSPRHEMSEALARAFVTPIDREDIYALANSLDDGVDLLQGTLQRMVMYRTGKAMTGAISLTKLLIECTEALIQIFSLLKDIKKNELSIIDDAHKIERLESEGDRVYRHEMAYLFDKCKDPIELIKWKDILENLEETLDYCEKLSDMIRGVVMKYACAPDHDLHGHRAGAAL